MNTPDLKLVPAPAFDLSLGRWRLFFELVRDVRKMQSLYRRTMDPIIRREAEKMEHQLDAEVGWIAADLAAVAVAVEQLAEAVETAEGGAL